MSAQKESEGKSLSFPEVAVSLRNISKEFKIYDKNEGNNVGSSRSRGLRTLVKKPRHEKIEVLKDVSFDVMKGEMVGILGRNGSGKSTLLKIIAGIIEPTSGTVKVNGKMTSLLSLQTGFNPKLTARENVIQYGLVFGLPKAELVKRVDEVLKFAELAKFADVEIAHFSSGMSARLAFSASMLVNPDILLLDELLSVGDHFFTQKSTDAFRNVLSNKGTVIFVSHSLPSIEQYCDRAMLLHHGRIEIVGKPQDVIKRYIDLGLQDSTVASTTSASGPSDAWTFAPTNIYSNDSPLLSGLAGHLIKRLRWRAKVLIEQNDFAFRRKSVLDVYCQNGELMYAAVKLGAKHVEGIELDEKMANLVSQHFKYHEIGVNKYHIYSGNFIDILRDVSPRKYDTIICNGVIANLINNSGLIEQIIRLEPSYVIIDANVSNFTASSKQPLGEKNDNSMRPPSISGESGGHADFPSKDTLEFHLKRHGLRYRYIDWANCGIVNWIGLEDYASNRRISIIATI